MAMMDKDPTRIAEEAAEYFARRLPHGKPSRRDDLAQWLQSDLRHGRAYGETQHVWKQLGVLHDDAELRALRTADLAALRRPQRWFSRGRMLAVAALLVLLLGGGYLLSAHLLAPAPPLSYATVLGEQRTETLPDGTQIVLNTDSALQARYSRSRREIELQRGEAQFEVARDASRPFVVRVGEDVVTALGTRFQVRRDQDEVVVTLLEGSVEIAHGQARHRLRPRDQARLARVGGVTVRPVDLELATSWLDGWLRFRGVSLHEVLAEANRYSGRKILLGDPKLADIQFNGDFRAGDSASIAAAAALILPVRVEEKGRDIVLQPE